MLSPGAPPTGEAAGFSFKPSAPRETVLVSGSSSLLGVRTRVVLRDLGLPTLVSTTVDSLTGGQLTLTVALEADIRVLDATLAADELELVARGRSRLAMALENNLGIINASSSSDKVDVLVGEASTVSVEIGTADLVLVVVRDADDLVFSFCFEPLAEARVFVRRVVGAWVFVGVWTTIVPLSPPPITGTVIVRVFLPSYPLVMVAYPVRFCVKDRAVGDGLSPIVSASAKKVVHGGGPTMRGVGSGVRTIIVPTVVPAEGASVKVVSVPR